jgi:hypothetical protein
MDEMIKNISEISNIVSAIATFLGLFLIFWQVRIAAKSFAHDYSRRKKESTFNMYNLLRERIRELDRNIRKRYFLYHGESFSGDKLYKLLSDKKSRDELVELLGILERIAVGTRNGIYDINILNELSGTVIISMYKRYKPYIMHVRKRSHTFYESFEWLANQLSQMRKNK